MKTLASKHSRAAALGRPEQGPTLSKGRSASSSIGELS